MVDGNIAFVGGVAAARQIIGSRVDFPLRFGAAKLGAIFGGLDLLVGLGARLADLAKIDEIGGHDGGSMFEWARSFSRFAAVWLQACVQAVAGPRKARTQGVYDMTTNDGPSGRVALITGAASGIGLATLDALTAAGWRVAAIDRNEATLDKLRQRAAGSAALHVAACDVCDEAAVTAVVSDVVKRFGRIDGVVNSAGIGADIPALDTPVDLFRRILDVNVIGSFIVARAVARVIKVGGNGGAIVNMASISGLRGSKGRVAYGASKGAVVTMTQVLANDLAEFGIRVNAIAPGPIETPMVAELHSKEDRELYMRYMPMARYGTPAEIASAVVFLLDGSVSGFITGEILAVDGGYRGAGIISGRK